MVYIPGKPEKPLAVFASTDEMVSWLADCLHDVPHLERQYIEPHQPTSYIISLDVCLEHYVRSYTIESTYSIQGYLPSHIRSAQQMVV